MEEVIQAYDNGSYVLEKEEDAEKVNLRISLPRSTDRVYYMQFVDNILQFVEIDTFVTPEPYEPELEEAPAYFVEGQEQSAKQVTGTEEASNAGETEETTAPSETETNPSESEPSEAETSETEVSDATSNEAPSTNETINFASTEETSSAASLDAKSPYEFKFQVNGENLALHDPVQKLLDLGFVCEEELGEIKLDAFTGIFLKFYLGNDYHGAYVTVANFGEDQITADQAVIAGIQFETAENYLVPFQLYGGITENSSLEELRAAFGQSTDERKAEYGTNLEYGINRSKYQFMFDNDGKMTQVQLNYSEPLELPENFLEIQKSVKKHGVEDGKRLALSEDPFAFSFYLDHAYYQMPASIADLMADGWMLVVKPAESIPAQNTQSGLMIMKDNQFMRVTLINTSDKEAAAEDCAIYSLLVASEGIDWQGVTRKPLEISRGIVLGKSTLAEFKEAYADSTRFAIEEEYDESTELTSVSLQQPGNSSYSYYLKFKNDILVQVEMSIFKTPVAYEPQWEEASPEFLEAAGK